MKLDPEGQVGVVSSSLTLPTLYIDGGSFSGLRIKTGQIDRLESGRREELHISPLPSSLAPIPFC